MSVNPSPSVKTSRRQRFLSHLTSRSRALLPLPSPSPSQGVFPGTAPAGPVLPNSLTTGTAPVSSTQAISTPFSSPNLLHDVLKRLSDNDQATFRDYTLHNAGDIDLALEQVLAAAKEKQRCCIAKRWTFTFTGRTVVLKEEADKVVGWLNRFSAVGDVVANVDPMHVGLPWAGIRLLLKVKAYASE